MSAAVAIVPAPRRRLRALRLCRTMLVVALIAVVTAGCGPEECADGSRVEFESPALHVFDITITGKNDRTETYRKYRTPGRTKEDLITEACNEFSGGPRSAAATSAVSPAGAAAFPSDIVYGDFDADGENDVAVANEGTSNVAVRRGTAGGIFTDPVVFPTGTAPVAIVAGRFDADPHLDLLTANAGDFDHGDLSLLRGNGDGTFQAPVAIAAGMRPADVAAADLDGDGALDLAVADAGGSAVVVRLGNGNGTFQPETTLPTGHDTRSIVVAQLGGSAALDLLSNAAVFVGAGNGTFAAAIGFGNGFAPTLARAGLVDGDAVADVVAASLGENLVSVLLGTGDGTLQPPRHYRTGNGPQSLALDDLDEDGHLDALVAFAGDDHVAILHGDGTGRLDGVRAYPTIADVQTRLGATDAAVADFTGDGVPDVVVANGGTRQGSLANPLLGGEPAVVLPGVGGGELGAPIVLPEQPGARVVAGDWDGDGKADVAFTVAGSGGGIFPSQLSIRRGKGDGSFEAPATLPLADDDTQADAIVTALLDAGTVPDLLVANTGADSVSVLLGDGAGGFAPAAPVPTGIGPVGLVTGRFDDDAHLDLVVVEAGDFGALNGGLSIARGNGDGTFQAPVPIRTGVGPDAAAAADFDGDGALDLAVSLEVTTFDWDVEILRGNGDGTFQAPVRVGLTEDLLHDVRAGDADGDGKPDLAVGVASTRTLGLRGRGDGTFEPPFGVDSGAAPIVVADLDGDGLPDAVGPSAGLLGVLLNHPPAPEEPDDPEATTSAVACWTAKRTKGGPSFTKQKAVPAAEPLWSASAGDPRLVDLVKALAVCAPASVNGADPAAPARPGHLERYRAKTTRTRPKQPKLAKRTVALANALGAISLALKAPAELLVPSGLAAGSGGAPDAAATAPFPHRCFRAKDARRPRFARTTVDVADGLGGQRTVVLRKPTRYCVPATTGTGDAAAWSATTHLVCYAAKPSGGRAKPAVATVSTRNRFGDEVLAVKTLAEVCLPSTPAP